MKLKAPEGCTSLSLEGKNIPIKDGIIEVNTHIGFLLENGFKAISEDAEAIQEIIVEPVQEKTKEVKIIKRTRGK